jgi:hypothetical protein
MSKARIQVDFTAEGADFHVILTRAEADALCQELAVVLGKTLTSPPVYDLNAIRANPNPFGGGAYGAGIIPLNGQQVVR